ncbi:MAG: hypothetical protein ACOYI8_04685 [Christensenellales bacterium]|jgi:hypothetical protein
MNKGAPHWGLVLLIEGILMLIATFLLTMLTVFVGNDAPYFYRIVYWGLLPILGALLSYKSVMAGVNNYAAWVMIPPMFTLGHYLAVFLLPKASYMLLCAFAGIVGSAAGYEADRRRNGGKH